MQNMSDTAYRFTWLGVGGAFLCCLLTILTGCANQENQPAQVIEGIMRPIVLPEDSTTATLFVELMERARADEWNTRPVGEIMVQVGQWFNGKPYVAGTLDESAYEKLVLKLDGFDCVTLVESTMALARTIKDQSYSYGVFEDHIRSQRYRDGTMDGYCSRLHYFSEWILDNEARGHVQNITRDIGGVRLEKGLDFMSNHRDSYTQLADDSLYAGVVAMEEKLKDYQMYYVPQAQIGTVYNQLLPGDVIALATDIEGLDVAHTGLVFKHEDGSVGLLHASTANGVIVSPDLQAYVENNRRQIGIVVARPQEMSNAE
jgi:hypothetical protein